MKFFKLFALASLLCVMALSTTAQEVKVYRASQFGIKSDGATMNTSSIQHAIDYISENGGGRLVFYVGRYLTGSIMLKSNVEINLQEGAILVGSTNPYDYPAIWDVNMALVGAYQAENIKITGQGVIDGRGRQLALNFIQQIYQGFIPNKNNLKYDRTNERPNLVYFRECNNVTFDGIMAKNSGNWTLYFDQCENLTVNNITVDSKNYWNNDGIDIVDCKHVLLQNSFFDAADDAICLKSHDAKKLCQDVEVRNCVARSSASGIKFGTMGRGGFKDIRILNNKVYDTHRSAFTVASVDGGIAEDILVDGLYSYNTGNAIYLRVGSRNGKVSSMKNITIQNCHLEVVAHKADSGYSYEGPVEDNPRNLSPSSIVGLDGNDIDNVTIRNVEIVYDGGGNANYAYKGTSTSEINSIPEQVEKYPEFSQFKELPAWGFWVRHAKNINFENVTLKAKASDYRPAVVMSDVKGAKLQNMKYEEPGAEKEQVVLNKCSKIEK